MKILLLLQLPIVILFSVAIPWPLPDIHVIGDSHSSFSFSTFQSRNNKDYNCYNYEHESLEYSVAIHIHHITDRTMHRFGLTGCDEKYLKGVNPGDFLVFCMGEIDVRCHIFVQTMQKKRKLHEVVSTLVSNYMNTILKYKDQIGFVPVVMGVIPPVKIVRGNFPSRGDYRERLPYTELLNKELLKLCRENAIMYFDVDTYYCDSQGLLDEKYITYEVHIHSKYNAYVKQKLCDLIFAKYNELLEKKCK